MNLGGLIAGALGGVAKAGVEIADDSIKAGIKERERQQGLTDRISLINQEMDLKRKEADLIAEKDQRGFEAAREGGEKLGIKRDAGLIGSLGKKVAGAAEQMPQDEIEKLLAENPEYRKVWEDAKYMDPRKQSEEYDLQLESARSSGATATVRKELTDRADKSRNAERQAEADAQARLRDDKRWEAEQRRLDQGDRNAAANERRASAAETRAERVAAGSKDSPEKIKSMTSMDIDRAIGAARESVAIELGVPANDVPQAIARLRKSAASNPKSAERLAELKPALEQWDALRRRQMDLERNLPEDKRKDTEKPEPSAPKVSQKDGQSISQNKGSALTSLPPGAKVVGTSKGKTVYEVNGKRYIQQ